MFKNRYLQEREFEKQSKVRLRGKNWYQGLMFCAYLAVGSGVALFVGALANVIQYFCQLLANFALGAFGVHFDVTWSPEYLSALFSQSLSGQTLSVNDWWVTIMMLIVMLITIYKGAHRWWDWTQLYGLRTKSINRFASLAEIDQTYKLVPDRNAHYAGHAGLPMAHINGYGLDLAKHHPLLWLKQYLKGPLGLNREVFPFWYRAIRPRLVAYFPKAYQQQANVKGGYRGFYYIDDQPTHSEVLGATRSGKDQTIGYIFIDLMRRAEVQPNLVDTDAKNEDAKMSYIPLREAGYEVQLLNIQDVDWSESWNPLQTALEYVQDGEYDKARDEALTVVQILSGAKGPDQGNGDGKIWDEAAQDMQLSIILYLLWLSEEHDDPSLVTPASIIQFANSMNTFADPKNPNADGLTNFFKLLQQMDPMPPLINDALLRAGSFLSATDATKTSILFSFQSSSRLFTSETIARLTSQSTIQVSDYGFPRLAKFQFSGDTYALATAKVQLIDTDNNVVLETDKYKVTRSGVIKAPFQHNFPTNWEMRVTFEDDNNPKYLQKGRVSIFGTRRHKKRLNGQYHYDRYSKQPVIQLVPERKVSDLVDQTSLSYGLRYSEKPAAVFIVTPQDNDNYASLASLFLGQIFSTNTAIASEMTARKMTRRTIYKLNEFSMYPRIPGFDNFLTRGLTYGHIVNIYLQDNTQLTKHYTQNEATEIANQMLTVLYILSKDKQVNKDLSEALGDIEIQKESANFQSGSDRQNKGNIQSSVEKKPLLAANEIAQLLPGEMIVLRTAKRNDKRFRKVRPLPIFATHSLMMPNSRDLIGQAYRLDYYTTDLRISHKNAHLAYQDLFLDFKPYYHELEAQVTGKETNQQPQLDDWFTDTKEENLIDTFLNPVSDEETQTLDQQTVEDETAFVAWQAAASADPNGPFIPQELLTDLTVLAEVEELMHGIMSKINYLHKTDQQTNAYQLTGHSMYFVTYPQMNTNVTILTLLNNSWESTWELRKRLAHVSPVPLNDTPQTNPNAFNAQLEEEEIS